MKCRPIFTIRMQPMRKPLPAIATITMSLSRLCLSPVAEFQSPPKALMSRTDCSEPACIGFDCCQACGQRRVLRRHDFQISNKTALIASVRLIEGTCVEATAAASLTLSRSSWRNAAKLSSTS